MRIRLLLILAAVFSSVLSSCTRVRYLREVSQVKYTEESGTIPPELQLYEQIIITRDKVALARNGKTSDTQVNEGTWEIDVDEQEVGAFFEQLETIDCSSIKRIEPDELDIGGGTKSYSIVYAGDKTLYLRYGRGVTYRDGRLIVEPMEAFIERMPFPAGAASQYKSPAGQP